MNIRDSFRRNGCASEAADLPLAVLPRSVWNLEPGGPVPPLKLPAQYIFCMHTNSQGCYNQHMCVSQLRKLHQIHTKRHGHPNIRYNFVIAGDGNVYEGRGWNAQPFLPKKYTEYEDKSLLFGFVGVFTEDDLPEKMLKRREELLKYAISNNYLTEDFSAFEIFQA